VIWLYGICDRPDMPPPRRRGLAQAPLDGIREGGLLADVIVLLPTALLTLIFGDLVPEAIGSTRADSLARWFVMWARGLSAIQLPRDTM